MTTTVAPPPPPPPSPPAEEASDPAATPKQSRWEWLTARLRRPPAARRAVRPVRKPPPDAVVLRSSVLGMLALVCGWVLLHLMFFSAVSHDRAQGLLFREFRTQLAAATAPIGPGTEPGDPVALLTIPAIGVEEVVVEGTASGDLFAGPGHKRNTVMPGQVGVSLIYGRSTTYGAPFRNLADLKVGDLVGLTTGQGEQRLAVTGIRRDGDPLPAALAEGSARVTLVSAEGDGALAALAPGSALYVDLETTDGQPSPGGYSPVVPESEEAMARGTAALPIVCLTLALLIAAAVGIVLARRRWSGVLVLVVSAPLIVALAWGATDAAMRLLPNLI